MGKSGSKPNLSKCALVALALAAVACGGVLGQVGQAEPPTPALPSAVTLPPGPAGQAVDCDAQLAGYRPYTGLEVIPPPDLAEPPARQPFADPTFGACVVRVTDRASDIDPSDASPGLKNEYSRIQSFNADGSLIMVRGIEATWYIYDARTLERLALMPFDGPIDPRWDASDPNIVYTTPDTRLVAYNVRTGQSWTVRDFADEFPGVELAAVWTRNEGSPSADGRYWAFMVEDQDWETIALLTYDLEEDRVLGIRDVPPGHDPDSVSMGPSGEYVFGNFEYCEEGVGSFDNPCGAMVYTRDLSDGWGLVRNPGHGDPALDAEGREVLVFQDNDTDHLSMVPLAGGPIVDLWPIDFSHTALGFHISGRAFKRPGWALVAVADGDPTSYTWMDDQVFAMELRPGGRVVRLAHHHSLVDERQEHDYWAEPHASVNQDFTRVLFTTNWGRSGTEEVEMFMIQLPPDWDMR
jgi:hypothetical protein